MEKALEFVGKLISKSEEDKVNFCDNCVQVYSSNATIASFTVKHKVSSGISTVFSTTKSAFELCDWSPTVKTTNKQLILHNKKTTFKASLPYSKDYEPTYISNNIKTKSVPSGLKDILKVLSKFTAKDSDHPWAESVIIHDNWAYSTNNIVVVRDKIKGMPNVMLPRQLIALMLKIKDTPVTMSLTEGRITFTYSSEAFIQTAQIAEKPPEIWSIFEKFKKPSKVSDTDIKAIRDIISMTTTGELTVNNGTIRTDTATIKNTGFDSTKVDSENIEKLLSVFDCTKFGKQLLMFRDSKSKMSAIMAARV